MEAETGDCKVSGWGGGDRGREAAREDECEHTTRVMNRERSGWLEDQVGHGAQGGYLVNIGHLGADKSCCASSRRLDSILRAAGSPCRVLSRDVMPRLH